MPAGVLRRLRRDELPVDALAMARFLVGAALVRDEPDGRLAVRIIETEAYLPGDAAAHSFRGRTARNGSLFLRPGHAYVYFIYGNHFCFNVSAEPAGIGAGVLIRAGQALAGFETMRIRAQHVAVRDVLRGPGRLARALGIGRADDGRDLCGRGDLYLAMPAVIAPPSVGTSVRIGLSREIERPWRFFELGNSLVSGPKALSRR